MKLSVSLIEEVSIVRVEPTFEVPERVGVPVGVLLAEMRDVAKAEAQFVPSQKESVHHKQLWSGAKTASSR